MKRLLCFILINSILTAVIITAYAHSAEIIDFYDAETDTAYHAQIFDNHTEIYRNSELLVDVELNDIISCSASEEYIYLFEADNINRQLCVYRYNSSEGIMIAYAVNVNPLYNKLCFTSDIKGNIFFTAADKTETLYVYNTCDYSVMSFDTDSRICQIINIGNNKILVITDISVYVYENETYERLMDSSLSYPLNFESRDTISDASGIKYYASDFDFSQMQTTEYIEATTNDTQSSSTKSSEAVSVTDNAGAKIELIAESTYVVPVSTTLSEIKRAFASSVITKVTKADGSIIENGKVGTGTKVHFENGEYITLIILGEVTGEGNINSRDTRLILDVLTGKETLMEPFEIAADLDLSGDITTKDALKIAKMYD